MDLGAALGVRAVEDDPERPHLIEVVLPRRTFVFSVEDAGEFAHWLRALHTGMTDPRLLTSTAAKCSARSDLWLADAADATRRFALRDVARMLCAGEALGGAGLEQLAVRAAGMTEWVPLRTLVDQQLGSSGGGGGGGGAAAGGFEKVTSDQLQQRGEVAVELKLLQELAVRGADIQQPEDLAVHLSASAPTTVTELVRVRNALQLPD